MVKRIILFVLGIVPNSIIWLWQNVVPDAFTDRATELWFRLSPMTRLRIEKAVTDFWTYALVGVTALTLPTDASVKAWVMALGGIFLNAARRAWYAS